MEYHPLPGPWIAVLVLGLLALVALFLALLLRCQKAASRSSAKSIALRNDRNLELGLDKDELPKGMDRHVFIEDDAGPIKPMEETFLIVNQQQNPQPTTHAPGPSLRPPKPSHLAPPMDTPTMECTASAPLTPGFPSSLHEKTPREGDASRRSECSNQTRPVTPKSHRRSHAQPRLATTKPPADNQTALDSKLRTPKMRRTRSFGGADSERSYDWDLCLPTDSRFRDKMPARQTPSRETSVCASQASASQKSCPEPMSCVASPAVLIPKVEALSQTLPRTSPSRGGVLSKSNTEATLVAMGVGGEDDSSQPTFPSSDHVETVWGSLPAPGKSANLGRSEPDATVRNEAVTFLLKSRSWRVRKMKSEANLNVKAGMAEPHPDEEVEITTPRWVEEYGGGGKSPGGESARTAPSVEIERKAIRMMEDAILLLKG
ncbi:hypothetical protein BC829DRAFT_379374 [Chytridium lagenaria]|nr:hypothetical protein BC829DRAFT_379374 [Chytridium lagenaria]